LLNISFYNVGQGDAIQITWHDKGQLKLGIVDCNTFPDQNNKIITYIKDNSISEIEFIVLSHFHYDHFSGMNDIFEFCIENNIKIKFFLHTLIPEVLDIYDRIFYSKKVEKEIVRFMHLIEFLQTEDEIPVSYHIKPLNLFTNVYLSFYAPEGVTYRTISKKISRKKNKVVTTSADINRLSTIIGISNDQNEILLTSDAVKKSFIKIKNRIKKEVLLAQVPHHGSFKNISPAFWEELPRKSRCPAIFSIGEEPKDTLPNFETVKLFENLNYDIYSTNCCYGIKECFKPDQEKQNFGIPSSSPLDIFSTKLRTIYTKPINDKFNGDKEFSFFK
jgi:hypothetical protein